jgi:hypothetical protein
LEGFLWLDDLRPSKQDVMAKRAPVAITAQPATAPKGAAAKKKAAPAKTKKSATKSTQLTPTRN